MDVVRCDGCGLIFVHPLPPAKAIRGLYREDYFRSLNPLQGGYEDYAGDEPLIRRTFLRRLPLLEPYLPASDPSSVLDVGCATGVFLEVMRERGWRTAGLDCSRFAVGAARAKGLDVREGALGSVELPAGTFDLVTLWDVLEHFEDPGAALRVCHGLLKPGGRLALSTPDASAWLARLLGSYWLGFRSVGEHLYFFERGTLARMLEEAGFRVLSFRSVGKYLTLERVFTRLAYYTRVFRLVPRLITARPSLYLDPGDTMCAVAARR